MYNMYTMNNTTQTVSTAEARKHFGKLVNRVRYSHRPVVIGRRGIAEALLIRFPEDLNADLSDTTNMNQYGGAFEYLADQPNLYSRSDLKVRYV